MNLTAIREPEQIIVRHFGESFFLGGKLAEAGVLPARLTDVGSGAGFPGIPLKIAYPEITLTLIEAQQRKAVFLREVLRALNLDGDVKNTRVESLSDAEYESVDVVDVVTLRAVERFESILPVAMRLVRPGGHLALLIGSGQVEAATKIAKGWEIAPLWLIPGADSRGIMLLNQVG